MWRKASVVVDSTVPAVWGPTWRWLNSGNLHPGWPTERPGWTDPPCGRSRRSRRRSAKRSGMKKLEILEPDSQYVLH